MFPFFSQVCLGTITATSTERARRRSFNTITTQAEWLHGVYDGWGLEEADMQCHLYPASSPCSSERIGGEGARNENTPPNLLPQHRGRGSRGADASRHVHLPTFPVVTLCKPAKSYVQNHCSKRVSQPCCPSKTSVQRLACCFTVLHELVGITWLVTLLPARRNVLFLLF